MFTATVSVTLKDSIVDPQGRTGLQALNTLGFLDATNLRVGKYYAITVNTANEMEARSRAEQMCEKLFANPVIEKWSIIDVKASEGTAK